MKSTKHLIVISFTLIIISFILGSSFKKAFEHLNTIKTTGSAKRDFLSDIIVWDGSFSTKNLVMQEAYNKLDQDKRAIIEYLSKNNVPIEDAIFSSIHIDKVYNNKREKGRPNLKVLDGYILTQDFKIESRAVDEMEHLSRDITSLINKGIEIQSNKPYYFYSRLADLKIDMISEATRDANLRAEKIAENSSSGLGKLLNAHMGVFQITAKHSTEKYTWGGTHNKTSRYKTAHITMKLTYDVQ
jgi:hypothetical protein